MSAAPDAGEPVDAAGLADLREQARRIRAEVVRSVRA